MMIGRKMVKDRGTGLLTGYVSSTAVETAAQVARAGSDPGFFRGMGRELYRRVSTRPTMYSALRDNALRSWDAVDAGGLPISTGARAGANMLQTTLQRRVGFVPLV